jgi:Mce-associated membrane protein
MSVEEEPSMGGPEPEAGGPQPEAGPEPEGGGPQPEAGPEPEGGGPQPETDGPEVADAAEPRPGSRRRRVAAALLGAATVIIGSVGVWALVAGNSLRAAAAHANAALTDRTATKTVDRAIAHAVNTIFSYNYADTARTRSAAQGLLTGTAIRQYNELFRLVERQAPKQKLVVTTRVTSIGVELLTGGRARVLVFANQQDTRVGTGQTSYGGAMFAVTAVSENGQWKIENIDTFPPSSG